MNMNRKQARLKKSLFHSNSEKADSQKSREGYRAFISYRHLPIDRFAAIAVHRLLERYSIPKDLRKDPAQKHIGHIFRDEDELPLSNDLSASIKSALLQSELLIVICTPDTAKSKWVNEEINTFLQRNPRDRVVAVLADGEPETAFPPQLRFVPDPLNPGQMKEVEPLAADIRSKTKAGMFRKLQKEKLRIMAQILEVPYDRLADRDRNYRLKRILTIGATAAIALTGFTAYTIQQNIQIRTLYAESQNRLAETVVNEASDALARGDRIEAMKGLISLTDEKGNALASEQQNLLAQILGCYSTDEGNLIPHRKIPLNVPIKDCCFNQDGSLAAVQTENGITVIDMETGENIWEIDPIEVDPRLSTLGSDGEKISGRFLKDGNLLLRIENALFKADPVSKKILGKIAMGTHQNHETIDQESMGKTTAYYASKNHLWAVDTETMKLIGEAELPDLHIVSSLIVSDDGLHAAIKEQWWDQPERLISVDLESSPDVHVVSENASEYFGWMDNGVLVFGEKQGVYGEEGYEMIRLCSAQKDAVKKSNIQIHAAEYAKFVPFTRFHIDEKKYPVYCEGNSLKIIDLENEKILWENSYLFGFKQIFPVNSECFYYLNNNDEFGLGLFKEMENGYPKVYSELQSSLNLLNMKLKWGEDGFLSGITSAYVEDDQYGLISFRCDKDQDGQLEQQGNLLKTEYSTLKDGTLIRFVLTRDTETRNVWNAVIYNTQTNECLLKKKITVEPHAGADLSLDHVSEKYLSTTVNLINGDSPGLIWCDGSSVYRTDLEDKQSESETKIAEKEVLCFSTSADGSMMFVSVFDSDCLNQEEDARNKLEDLNPENRLYVWNSENHAYELKSSLELPSAAGKVQFSADGRFLILAGPEFLASWDITAQRFVSFDTTESDHPWLQDCVTTVTSREITTVSDLTSFRMAKEHPWIIYPVLKEKDQANNGEYVRITGLEIADYSTGQILNQIELEELELKDYSSALNERVDFTQHDQVLMILDHGESQGSSSSDFTLTRFDLNRRNIKFKTKVGVLMETPEILSADNEGNEFTLHYNNWLGFSPAGGVTWDSRIYDVKDDKVSIRHRIYCNDLYYDKEQKEMIINTDGILYTRPVYTFQELTALAKEEIAKDPIASRNSE